MALIYVYKDRGLTRDLIINDVNGDPIVPVDDDKLRIIIGHEGLLGTAFVDAELSFDSDNPTTNGSSITKALTGAGLNRMRLDASDLNFKAGVYTLIFDLFDSTDGNEWKNISRQILVLEES